MTVDIGLDLGLADHADIDHQGAMPPGGNEVAAKAGLLALGVKGRGKEKGQRGGHSGPSLAHQLEHGDLGAFLDELGLHFGIPDIPGHAEDAVPPLDEGLDPLIGG